MNIDFERELQPRNGEAAGVVVDITDVDLAEPLEPDTADHLHLGRMVAAMRLEIERPEEAIAGFSASL